MDKGALRGLPKTWYTQSFMFFEKNQREIIEDAMIAEMLSIKYWDISKFLLVLKITT